MECVCVCVCICFKANDPYPYINNAQTNIKQIYAYHFISKKRFAKCGEKSRIYCLKIRWSKPFLPAPIRMQVNRESNNNKNKKPYVILFAL